MLNFGAAKVRKNAVFFYCFKITRGKINALFANAQLFLKIMLQEGNIFILLNIPAFSPVKPQKVVLCQIAKYRINDNLQSFLPSWEKY
jgi:hypothetical protein